MKLFAFLLVLALTWSCAPPHQVGDIVQRRVLPKFKFHFGDKVVIESEFYGKCIGTVTSPPYWFENCAVNGNGQQDYLYFFSEMQCRGGGVSGVGTIIERCERSLKRVK